MIRAHKTHIGILLLVALAGGALVIYATRWGPWAIEDTLDYFDVARNFAAGRGLVMSRPSGNYQPLHIHPPLYAIVMALPAALGLDLLAASRWLNAALFAATIFLTGWSALRLSRSAALAVGLSLILATSPALLYDFSGAMAEGLYFFLGFAALGLLLLRLPSPGWGATLASALLAGLALLARFSGAAFVAAGALALLLWGGGGWRARIAKTLVYGLASGLPFAVWTASVRLLYPGVNPGYYDLSFTAPWETLTPVRAALVNGLWQWLGLELVLPRVPYALKLAGLALLGLAFALLLARALTRKTDSSGGRAPTTRLLVSLAAFALASLAIVVISYLVVVIPKPALYERIWSPFEIAVLLCLVLVAFLFAAGSRSRLTRLLPVAVVVFVALTQVPRLADTAQRLHDEGEGFTGRAWVTSPALDVVRGLPAETPVISNMPAPIFFLTGRQSHDMIADLINAGPNPTGTRYGDNPSDPSQRLFRQQGAALVLFKGSIDTQLGQIYPQSSEFPLNWLAGGLSLLAETSDAWIYTYPPTP